MSLGDDVIRMMQMLTVTQGPRAGQKLDVLPWQRKMVRGFVNNRMNCVTISRGAGKSTIAAAIACAGLIGPLARRRADVVLVAASFQQARILFEHARSFLEPLTVQYPKRFRISDSANAASITDRKTGARIRCLASDPKRLHGLAPSLIIADEGAQWPPHVSDRMRSALVTSMGKVENSRFLAIGTRPSDPGHWLATMIQGGCDFSLCYAARPDDPPFRLATWRRANPSLAHMPALEVATRAEALLAKRDPALLASFKALRLNMGVSDIEMQVLLDAGTWERIEAVADRSGPLILGIDLGTNAAQSAVAAYWPQTGALAAIAAFPCEPSLAERGLRDGCGRLYAECARRGELFQLGQRASDIPALLRAAMERFSKPDLVVADRWREAELRDALEASGVPPAAFEARGMGFKDGAEDVRAFRRSCAEGKVAPAPSLLLRSAMAEARTVSDPAGNAKLCKGSEGGRRMRAKDDAAAAAILAVSAGVRSGLHLAPRGGVYMGMI